MKSIVPLVGIVVRGVLHEPDAAPVSLPDDVAALLIETPPPADLGWVGEQGPELVVLPTEGADGAAGGGDPASVAPAPATMARAADDLDGMDETQLIDLASKEGVSVDGITGKPAIAAAIRAHRAAQPPASPTEPIQPAPNP